ncbi:MAG: permease, partial [Deltaproteobacteria bacterium]
MITGRKIPDNATTVAEPGNSRTLVITGAGILGIYLWWLIYRQLPATASWITYGLFQIGKGSHLGESVNFFFYDTPKVMMLLFLVVFGVGIIRSFFTPEKTRAFLSGKSEFAGNILAALLGIITPFCSCSAVPLFIGFVEAGIPLGITFSFLIASPMINEIAVVMLLGLVGWKITLLYVASGLVVAFIGGVIIEKFR